MRMRERVLLAVLVQLIVLTGCRDGKGTEVTSAPTPVPSPSSAEAAGLITLTAESSQYAQLELAEAREQEVFSPLEATGRVILNEDQTVRVGAYVDGRVMKVKVRVGDLVRAGQVLAELHSHDVHEAGANLFQARASLVQSRNREVFAKTGFERATRLFQSRAFSKQELDRAQVEYESSQQDVIHAEAELERAKGHLEILGISPEKPDYDAPVLITAPSGGVVVERAITVGNSVNPGDQMFTISDLGQVWVVAQVEEKRLAELRINQSLTVEVAAYPGRQFSGRIAKVGDALNPQTRMVEVRCLIDNPGRVLKTEMYAVTRIASTVGRRVLVVPKSALQDIDGRTVVFVARDGRTFEKREVQTGYQAGELVEVLSGARPGERVVTAGSFLLKSELQKSGMDEE